MRDQAGGGKRRGGRLAAAEPVRYVLREEAGLDWAAVSTRRPAGSDGDLLDPSERLNQAVRDVLLRLLQRPMKRAQVASALEVTQDQAREWLRSATDDGALERLAKPVRYLALQTVLPGFDVEVSRGSASGGALAAVLRRAFLAAALPWLQSPAQPGLVAEKLGVTTWQAKRWLDRLAADRSVVRMGGKRSVRRGA